MPQATQNSSGKSAAEPAITGTPKGQTLWQVRQSAHLPGITLAPSPQFRHRLASRMARRCRPQAWIGIGIGVAVFGLWVALALAVEDEAQQDRARHEPYGREMERFLRDTQDRRAAFARERAAQTYLSSQVQPYVATSRFRPRTPLPSPEIARRLRVFRTEYAETNAARHLTSSSAEPYPTYRRVLADQPSDPDHLTAAAVEALTDMLASEEVEIRLLAVEALETMTKGQGLYL